MHLPDRLCGNPNVSKVLSALQRAPGGLTKHEFTRKIRIDPKIRDAALKELIDEGVVGIIRKKAGTKNVDRFVLIES